MWSNTLGNCFKITTFGESHGRGTGCVIDGVYPGLDLNEDILLSELKKRAPGISKFETSRIEKDYPVIISGVFKGKTTGTPICILFWNENKNSEDYEKIKDIFRPGHGDFTWLKKFGIRDYRGGGRSSGRETVARVAAGGVAKEILKREGIDIFSYTLEINGERAEGFQRDFVENNYLRCGDEKLFNKVKVKLNKIKENRDSAGGIVQVIISGVPAGIGDPVFNKLDSELGKYILSIGGVKGIEFGKGFSGSAILGSEHNDEMSENGFESNSCGGILGGISNGEDIVINVAVKPVSSIGKKQKTINIDGEEKEIEIGGRHDVLLIPRINAVIESMCAIAVLDALMIQKSIKKEDYSIDDLRTGIDEIDLNILKYLKKRTIISKKIGLLKKENNLKVKDKKRENSVKDMWIETCETLEMNSEYILKIQNLILEESKRIQK
jgi:chorismate synthase